MVRVGGWMVLFSGLPLLHFSGLPLTSLRIIPWLLGIEICRAYVGRIAHNSGAI